MFVIDAKRYQGRPHLSVEGGLFRPRIEKLVIGTRNGTKLVAGVHKQRDLVRTDLERKGLGRMQVTGMLCFVEADWPLIGGSFTVEGLHVLWPKKAADQLLKPGSLDNEQIHALHRLLATAFPPA